jgi:hypothetical protein
VNTKVRVKTSTASGQGMRPVRNIGTCQSAQITPNTALATSAEWRRRKQGQRIPAPTRFLPGAAEGVD